MGAGESTLVGVCGFPEARARLYRDLARLARLATQGRTWVLFDNLSMAQDARRLRRLLRGHASGG